MIQEPSYYNKNAYDMIGQYDNWCNLLDMANAVRYGFSQYRLPKPGQAIDVEDSKARVANIDKEWSKEHQTRGKHYQKPCPNFSLTPIETQCYLNSILEKVEIVINTADDYWAIYATNGEMV